MKHNPVYKTKKFVAIVYSLAIVGAIVFVNACQKNTQHTNSPLVENANPPQNMPILKNKPQTDVVNIISFQKAVDGTSAKARFSKHELLFNVTDAVVMAQLDAAVKASVPVKIVFDPWQAIVSEATPVKGNELASFNNRELIRSNSKPISIAELNGNDEAINHLANMGVINTTTTGLTPAIPDMATAQLIFNYFSAQCCQNPGPYSIDHCITFQYCEDGCYARAHKMCYLLNNKYHYATQKIFSFAVGGDNLSVKAEKWGGCCINWWYHVAPLVTINTTTGPKAFVFDPAMFDQPVLLTTWLHAQENPACSSTPHVTAFHIQPTASYSPASYSSNPTYDTDPLYSDTNTTLVNYKNNISCP